MSLAAFNRVLAVLLVLLAGLPLQVGGELPVVVWFYAYAGLGAGVVWGAKPWPKWATWLLTAALAAVLGVLVLLAVRTGDWLPNAIIFAIVASTTRALQLPEARQQFQLVGLSFLLLIASAVGNPDLIFAAAFIVYSILLTWALTSIHLLDRLEKTVGKEAGGSAVRRLISPRFLLGSSLLALGLMISSLALFFLFPRMGLGFFATQTRRGAAVSGFSDGMQLGHFGTIRSSSDPVLRVVFPYGGGPGSPELLRVRGMAFDRYEGGRWGRSETSTFNMRADADGVWLVPPWANAAAPVQNRVYVDIYAEPVSEGNRVIFTLERPLVLSSDASRFDKYRGTSKTFSIDSFGNIFVKMKREQYMGSMNYGVTSGTPVVTPEARSSPVENWPEWMVTSYLQLPDGLDSRIPELAAEIVGDKVSVWERARAVESWLRSELDYSLEGEPFEGDPVVNFLFERKAGHCEYFSSAMVLLLRAVDVPARPVNGFLGSIYNEFGDYYLVTSGSAHSWVEVFVPGAGWVTFDPTPSGLPDVDEGGFFSEVDQWFDSLRMTWYRWMVEYDLDKQLSVYLSLWNSLVSSENEMSMDDGSASELRNRWREVSSRVFSWASFGPLLGLGGGLLLLMWGIRLIRRRRPGDRGALLSARLKGVLVRKGIPVSAGDPLGMLVERARVMGFAGVSELEAVARDLDNLRFSQNPSVDASACRQAVTGLKRFPKVH